MYGLEMELTACPYQDCNSDILTVRNDEICLHRFVNFPSKMSIEGMSTISLGGQYIDVLLDRLRLMRIQMSYHGMSGKAAKVTIPVLSTII
ncbi:Protein of unknown function [Gryllus bimaculatus]|nr:Protein of unknown function [Gryllus bimaculatus]